MSGGDCNGAGRLSSRGAQLAAEEPSLYYRGLGFARENPYDARTRPDGVIQLGLADNKLSLDLISDRLQREMPVVDATSAYGEFHGDMPFRQAMAAFMSHALNLSQKSTQEHTEGRLSACDEEPFNRSQPLSIDPDSLVITSGATAAVGLLAHVLADAGDAFVVPTPYYPGFTVDLERQAGVTIIPAATYSDSGFDISTSSLEAALRESQGEGGDEQEEPRQGGGGAEDEGRAERSRGRGRRRKVRGVLLSSPSNPLGCTFSNTTLLNVLHFCRKNCLHLISDEIYAGSVYNGDGFTSLLRLAEPRDYPFLHIVYGPSKDLGIPGFRIGACYSLNPAVQSAITKLARFCSPSRHTQALLAPLLSDSLFAQAYLSENQCRLRKASSTAQEALLQIGVKCLPGSNAGVFLWCDFRQFISPKNSIRGEEDLFLRLLRQGGVNITPGGACGCCEPGWFRLCFAGSPEEELQLAIDRISRTLLQS
ncbi:hypothetical protein CLOM_g1503 [Closterium sp. NIES-68]|nr:hypothetical protein CLOM_g1503 [Closterium sp. NIES-68]